MIWCKVAVATVALLVPSASSAASMQPNEIVAEFGRLCLAGTANASEFSALVGKTQNWLEIPAPVEGRLFKSDENFAWQHKSLDRTYELIYSRKSKARSFSTICRIRTVDPAEASEFQPAFKNLMATFGFRESDTLGKEFYQYRGRAPGQKRSWATLSSAAVRQGFSVLSGNNLDLNIIY
jgi:hypothetical protein